MPLTLLDFFLDVRHIDSTTRMTMMNNPTSIPINSHAFNPKTNVFLDSPELRSVAILLLPIYLFTTQILHRFLKSSFSDPGAT